MNKQHNEDLIKMFERGPTENITLSEEDWERFMEVIENPPGPSEKLRAAFKKYGGLQ